MLLVQRLAGLVSRPALLFLLLAVAAHVGVVVQLYAGDCTSSWPRYSYPLLVASPILLALAAAAALPRVWLRVLLFPPFLFVAVFIVFVVVVGAADANPCHTNAPLPSEIRTGGPALVWVRVKRGPIVDSDGRPAKTGAFVTVRATDARSLERRGLVVVLR